MTRSSLLSLSKSPEFKPEIMAYFVFRWHKKLVERDSFKKIYAIRAELLGRK